MTLRSRLFHGREQFEGGAERAFLARQEEDVELDFSFRDKPRRCRYFEVQLIAQ